MRLKTYQKLATALSSTISGIISGTSGCQRKDVHLQMDDPSLHNSQVMLGSESRDLFEEFRLTRGHRVLRSTPDKRGLFGELCELAFQVRLRKPRVLCQVECFGHDNFTSGLISGANALCPWASGCYDVLGTSWFSERGKRRAEFKMNSSSELT